MTICRTLALSAATCGFLLGGAAIAAGITVHDARNRDVTISDPARIVSIGGAVTEILYALGFEDRLAGVDSTSLYPAAALYLSPAYAQKNPATVQSLANAFVRGLKWIAGHSAEDIARVMPPEHALGNMDLFVRSIRSSIPMYSPDGRFSREGAETALKVLREFDPAVRSANIDLAATYTEAFVDKVPVK